MCFDESVDAFIRDSIPEFDVSIFTASGEQFGILGPFQIVHLES